MLRTTSAAALLALLACAAAAGIAAARPLLGRRLTQDGAGVMTTWNVDWDVDYVPYPLVEAQCGDLITFRWDGRRPQTVAVIEAADGSAALANCRDAAPRTEPVPVGEYTEELLVDGTFYFVEPDNCELGQALIVRVNCAGPSLNPNAAASPAPAPSATTPAVAPAVAAAPVPAEDVPAPAPAAAEEVPAPAPAKAAPQPAPTKATPAKPVYTKPLPTKLAPAKAAPATAAVPAKPAPTKA
ncbi:secretin isoform A [Micractinium conductrix]|uniref:Secretin isoform A n=1 Tax=Micractinium conductrix TaxID=554055 RepID=A0A2P6UZX3_9CHLO|nr:secretin isoform B [Micractinium conductrix]PSC67373.1 secretin isoform A [Micractinium conductrix]|eukprot:PSC67372.1 secretin isoform B [Micractinium conductrix]